MQIATLLHDFMAFNTNAFSNLIYIFANNLWTLLFLASAVGTIILRLKDTVDNSVRDVQNIV